MHKRLSVIIPTYNRAAILKRCLDALARQTLPANQFEIVICDDGSKDSTPEIIAGFSDRLSIIALCQENRGPAAARNRAIGAATAELLMIINDDSILVPDALERHVQASAYHVINLGSFRTPPELKQDFFSALVDSTSWIFPFVHMQKPGVQGFDLFLTANVSLPAMALKEVGGFDETFPSPAGEDIELGYRLHKAGYVIMYDPAIVCFHDNIYTPNYFAHLRRMRGIEDMRFLNKYPALIGHYQDWCNAVARRWYAKLENEPQALADEVANSVQKMEAIVAAYAAAKDAESATRFRLIEKAGRELDHLGLLAYVEGITKSDYYEKIVGPYAVPGPGRKAAALEALLAAEKSKKAA